jgi:peptidoglycan/xylan/chitin deacetylase (PgdA/CDA1 family)
MYFLNLLLKLILIFSYTEASDNFSQDIKLQSYDIPVFVYHRFGDSRFPSTNVENELFRQQLEYLDENGYKVTGVTEALDLIQQGHNGKIAVITIDDGYQSFYKNGFPLLQKYGFSATLYVNTANVGFPDFMSWETLKAVDHAGIEIGNHSHSHSYFLNHQPTQRREKFSADLNIAQELFLENLGKLPVSFAFPYGEYNQEMVDEVEVLNFKSAVIQKSGIFSEQNSVYQIPRFPMGGNYTSFTKFQEKVKMKSLRVKDETSKTEFKANPPELVFSLKNVDEMNLKSMQFFVDGRKSENIASLPDGKFQFQADQPLKQRRTLYTITMSDLAGKWYWHSHLWINPSISELP